MTRLVATAIAFAALLLVPACSGGGAAGANGTGSGNTSGNTSGPDNGHAVSNDGDNDVGPPTAPTPEESLVKLFEDLAEDVDRADNCGGVANVLDGWVNSNAERYPALNDQAAERDLSDAQLEAFDGRIQESLVFVVDAIYECEDDSDVQVAFERFDELMESI